MKIMTERDKEKRELSTLAERANIPISATEKELEELGARCLMTNEFQKEGETTRIEYMVLSRHNEYNEELFVWKREYPKEEQYNLHGIYEKKKITNEVSITF